MKHLYIMRHAEAEDAEEGCLDTERALTKRGKRAARAMGRWMAANGVCPEVIATSPLKRALQTAAAVRKKLDGADPVTVPELAGQCSAKELVMALTPLVAKADVVLIVGHQPQLGQLVSLLVTGGIHGRLDLKKGALCHVILGGLRPGKCGSVDLLISPEFVS